MGLLQGFQQSAVDIGTELTTAGQTKSSFILLRKMVVVCRIPEEALAALLRRLWV